MSNSLKELIKNIQKEISTGEQPTYIYYDKDSGDILRLCGTKEEDEIEGEACLAVPHQYAEPMLTGERRTTDYIVIYDISLKQIVLKQKNYQDNHKVASQMCFQLPIMMSDRSGHLNCTEIYDNMKVFLWSKDHAYKRNDVVFYKNAVYKLLKANGKGSKFPKTGIEQIVDDVVITDILTQTIDSNVMTFKEEYVGVRVDIWYNNLEHLAGQHVWIDNCVYKIIKDQEKDTEFNPDNAEQIAHNVKLYKDDNPYAGEFADELRDGDLFLDTNKLYSATVKLLENTEPVNEHMFKINSHKQTIYDPRTNSFTDIDLSKDKMDYAIRPNQDTFTLVAHEDIKQGQRVLIGDRLYSVSVDKEYDIVITQDKPNKAWLIDINPLTLKFVASTYLNSTDVLYISITAKHDPNILIRSLKIPLSALTETHYIPFQYNIESSSEDVSIYTAKYFDSYAHEVIG